MLPFYFAAALAFVLIKVASLALHFLGSTPYGTPVVEAPARFLPQAAAFEAGILLVFAVAFVLAEAVARRLRLRTGALRTAYLTINVAWLLFGQFDQEVVRWLGNHVTLSYLRTYILSGQDSGLLARLFGADLGYFAAALALGIVAPAIAAVTLWRARAKLPAPRALATALVALLALAAVTSPLWWNFSEKRWRRIRPAGIAIAFDLSRGLRGLDAPLDARRAAADLASMLAEGRLADSVPPASGSGDLAAAEPEFPLWRTSPGRYTPEEFRALPRARRPNVVLVMFESLRGFRTGLTGDESHYVPYPPLAEFLKREATYFPWAHSHGYPSVEGCAGIHLGLWSHYNNVLISDYIHIRTRSLPEILRSAGYRAEMYFGYDPSFGNFTPWMNRWYDRLVYDPSTNVDGPLLRRVDAALDTLERDTPWMLTLWTTVTHPPFNVPASEHVISAPDVDGRYDQSLVYAGREMLAFLERLKKRPDWNNTVVILLGDHGIPTTWQTRNADRVGALNPGHTWTSLAFLGGWPGLPPRGLRRVTAAQEDIGPTVLGLLDLRAGNHFMGRDLFAPGADTVERALPAARFGDAAVVRGEHRLFFRMDADDEGDYFAIPKARDADYGLLDSTSARASAADTSAFPRGAAARYRDLYRHYGNLLDADRVMPPDAAP
jgi:lipoteichoic acid synthase